MSSSGTNYVPDEYEDIDQYGSFTIPPILQVWWIQMKSLLSYLVNELMWH